MKAQELRIGNYLQDNEGELCRVEQLGDWGGNKDIIEASAINGPLINLPLSLIPLTEKWLIRFGFEELKDKYRLQNSSTIYDIIFIKEEKVLALEDFLVAGSNVITVGYLNHIRFIHQLQNFYFALTSEELQLKSN